MTNLNLTICPKYADGTPVWKEHILLVPKEAPVNASYTLAPEMRHTFTVGRIVRSELRDSGWYYHCEFEVDKEGAYFHEDEWFHQDFVPVKEHLIPGSVG